MRAIVPVFINYGFFNHSLLFILLINSLYRNMVIKPFASAFIISLYASGINSQLSTVVFELL